MASGDNFVLMITEEGDARALQWLLHEASLADVYKPADGGGASSAAGISALSPDEEYAYKQGYGGARFDAARLWFILRKQLDDWATNGGKVWYNRASSGGCLSASRGYQRWPAAIRNTLAHGACWEVRVEEAESGNAVVTGDVLMAVASAFATVHNARVVAYLQDSLLLRRPAGGDAEVVGDDALRAVEDAVHAEHDDWSIRLSQRPLEPRLHVPAEPAKSGADAPVRSLGGGLVKVGSGRKRSRRGSSVGDPGEAGGSEAVDGEEGDDVLAPGVSKQDYEEMKARFEASHFYYVPANTFVEVTEDYAMRHYDLRHAKEYFDIGWAFGGAHNFRFRVSFLDLWRMDPSRKTIHRIDFKPSDDPTVFYLPLQFAYTRAKPEQLLLPPSPGSSSSMAEEDEDGSALAAHKEALWSMFMTLIKAACDDKAELVEYLLNYFAHMLQRPLEQPGVAIILTGQKGVGKDTLLDFFRLHVVGPGLSHNYTETRQFFDKHDVDRKDKIFVKVEDSDSALCKQHAKDLRARITAREGTINPKGKDPITFPNYVRYAFTANQAIPVGINDDNDRERRFVILPVSNSLKGNADFFAACYDEVRGLYTPLGGVTIAERLLERDLTGWNVRAQPKNDYQEALYETERTPEQRFLEDGWTAGVEYKSTDLFARYQRFCSDNGFPKYTETSIAFGQKLAYFVMQKKITKRVGGKKVVYYTKVARAGEMGEDEEEEAAGAGAGAGAGARTVEDAEAEPAGEFSFSTITRALS